MANDDINKDENENNQDAQTQNPTATPENEANAKEFSSKLSDSEMNEKAAEAAKSEANDSEAMKKVMKDLEAEKKSEEEKQELARQAEMLRQMRAYHYFLGVQGQNSPFQAGKYGTDQQKEAQEKRALQSMSGIAQIGVEGNKLYMPLSDNSGIVSTSGKNVQFAGNTMTMVGASVVARQSIANGWENFKLTGTTDQMIMMSAAFIMEDPRASVEIDGEAFTYRDLAQQLSEEKITSLEFETNVKAIISQYGSAHLKSTMIQKLATLDGVMGRRNIDFNNERHVHTIFELLRETGIEGPIAEQDFKDNGPQDQDPSGPNEPTGPALPNPDLSAPSNQEKLQGPAAEEPKGPASDATPLPNPDEAAPSNQPGYEYNPQKDDCGPNQRRFEQIAEQELSWLQEQAELENKDNPYETQFGESIRRLSKVLEQSQDRLHEINDNKELTPEQKQEFLNRLDDINNNVANHLSKKANTVENRNNRAGSVQSFITNYRALAKDIGKAAKPFDDGPQGPDTSGPDNAQAQQKKRKGPDNKKNHGMAA